MGIRRAARITSAAADYANLFLAAAVQTADDGLFPVPMLDAFTTGPVSRAEAMRVPALAQGLQVYSVLGTLPLTYRVGHQYSPAPSSISQPDPGIAPTLHYWNTYTDLILHGRAYWYVTAWTGTADKSTPRPASSIRIAPERVWADDDETLRVDDAIVRVLRPGNTSTEPALIVFDGPLEGGVLTAGAGAIRTALLLEAAAQRFANIETPSGYLRNVSGADLTEEQVTALLTEWSRARRTRNTAYLNSALEYHSTAYDPNDLQLVEARREADARVAQLLNLPPNFINAPQAGTSLDYTTLESRRRDLVELAFAPYMAAVTSRLTMTDVTPAGHEVAYDLAAFYRADLATLTSVGVQAVGAGLITVDEWRNIAGLSPMREATP